MKLGKAQWALVALTAVFIVFTLGFFTGRSTSRAMITTAQEPQQVQAIPAAPASTSKVRLNINKATASELEALPGVGTVLAERILLWREENGRFISTEQLLDVEGIGDEKLKNIRDLICVEDIP